MVSDELARRLDQSAAMTPPYTEQELTNLRAVTDVLKFWNTQDARGVVTFYADDIVWHNMGVEEVYHGKAEVQAFLERLFTAIPDLHFDVPYKFARDNFVAERWVITGHHRDTFMGIPATGRRLEIRGASTIEMRDGKFYRDAFFYDSGAILRQMGLMPPLSATQTAPGRAVLWALVMGTVAARAGVRAARKGVQQVRSRANGRPHAP